MLAGLTPVTLDRGPPVVSINRTNVYSVFTCRWTIVLSVLYIKYIYINWGYCHYYKSSEDFPQGLLMCMYMLNQGLSSSVLQFRSVCPSDCFLCDRAFMFYRPLWVYNHCRRPTLLCARVSARCKSNLLLWMFGHGFGPAAL